VKKLKAMLQQKMSKDYALGVIKDYAHIIENIPAIIKESGYKVEFISKRLNLPAKFVQKLKHLRNRHNYLQIKEMRVYYTIYIMLNRCFYQAI
jgi:TusA-related sulfurtransferase